MSEPEKILIENPSPSREVPGTAKPPARLRWIDQARGFVIFLLVLTLVFPPDSWMSTSTLGGSILHFFLGHAGAYDTYMTFYDVGAPAFIIIIGLAFSLSFRKRMEEGGSKAAVRHVVVRYGAILLLGILFVLVDGEGLIKVSETGLLIVRWDVPPTLGLVGFVTLVFVYIKDARKRMLVGYAWMLLYQVLMLTAGLKLYAQQSVHGGIFGTIFGFSGMMIVATSVGDYLFFTEHPDKQKYANLALFGALNLGIGLLISFIPGWEAAKRQVSLSYCLVSLGVTMLIGIIFVYLDKVRNKDVAYLQAMGQNPFLAYLLAEAPYQVLKLAGFEYLGFDALFLDLFGNKALGEEVGSVVLTIILVAYISVLMMYLFRHRKIISTQKVALIFIIVLGLAVVLVIAGII